MLNDNDRRPAFDRWFAGLEAIERICVIEAALESWNGLRSEGTPERPVSYIDCLENVWDEAVEHGILAATGYLADRPTLTSDAVADYSARFTDAAAAPREPLHGDDMPRPDDMPDLPMPGDRW